MPKTMTYGQIRDFVYKRLFQNTATEVITDENMAFAINIAQFDVISRISHPKLNTDFIKNNASLGTNFEFDNNFKNIFKIIAFKGDDATDDSQGIEIKQVFHTPYNEYEYRSIDNVIETYDEWKTLKVYGEIYLDDIDSTQDSWDTIFPLSITIAGALAENVMAQLVPANITEGYNLSQYHQSVYENQITRISRSLANITGEKKIKNKII